MRPPHDIADALKRFAGQCGGKSILVGRTVRNGALAAVGLGERRSARRDVLRRSEAARVGSTLDREEVPPLNGGDELAAMSPATARGRPGLTSVLLDQ